jgi:hypothetical protein
VPLVLATELPNEVLLVLGRYVTRGTRARIADTTS